MGRRPVAERRARQEQRREDAAFAAELRARGLAPLEVFRELTRRDCAHMEAQGRARGRCFRCWHSLRDGTCICAALRPLSLRSPLQLLVWCHARDYLNAGNSGGKLVSLLAGGAGAVASAQLLLFGRAEDEATLSEAMARGVERGRVMLLFPAEGATSVEQLVDGLLLPGDGRRHDGREGVVQGPYQEEEEEEEEEEERQQQQRRRWRAGGSLTVVVMDGTWRNVRPMLRHWRRVIDPDGAVPVVELQQPLAGRSVFRR
jgi:DTW domain-containing protein YfiP